MQRPGIDLFPSTDADGATLYVGRWNWPGKIHFHKGMAFIVYTDVDGHWELQLCKLDSPDLSNVLEYYDVQRRTKNRNRNSNLCIPLEMRFSKPKDPEEEPTKFYIGKINFDGDIDCGVESTGVVFLVFTADEGEEELQIGVIDPNKMRKRSKTPSPQSYRSKTPKPDSHR